MNVRFGQWRKLRAEELTHWKKCWEGLGAGGEGDNRRWDGWMASLTRRTWVWVNSGRWWWTGRPGVLQLMGSPSRTWLSDWTELNWYRKDLHDPDNHDGVITHLEPDILECEVKWVLGSITTNKASGGDGIPAELFQILKDDAVKVPHSLCQQIWKIQQWPQDWTRSVFILIPEKGNAKECSNYHKIALISHVSKVMLKILQARLQ